MITKEYLENWIEENEEDIVMDGPFDFDEKWSDFGIEVISALEKKFNVKFGGVKDPDSWYEELFENYSFCEECDIYGYGKGDDVILETMVDFINKHDIKEY